MDTLKVIGVEKKTEGGLEHVHHLLGTIARVLALRSIADLQLNRDQVYRSQESQLVGFMMRRRQQRMLLLISWEEKSRDDR